jgi:hypothetical protein
MRLERNQEVFATFLTSSVVVIIIVIIVIIVIVAIIVIIVVIIVIAVINVIIVVIIVIAVINVIIVEDFVVFVFIIKIDRNGGRIDHQLHISLFAAVIGAIVYIMAGIKATTTTAAAAPLFHVLVEDGDERVCPVRHD